MLIDTHAHLWFYKDDEIPGVIERARMEGIEKIIVPGTDLETSKKSVELAKQYPGIVYAAVGIHPEEISDIHNIDNVYKLDSLINENREQVVAIGEIGTDIFNVHQPQTRPPARLVANERELINAQKVLFRSQCEIANKYSLPVIIHTRESFEETMEVLNSLEKLPKGQLHCFSYNEAELGQVIEKGFYVSFCGNISWSKRLQKVSKYAPLDRILLETDSPFMTPLDNNGEKVGKQNEPKNVRISALIQANLRNITMEQLEIETTNNAQRLFKL